MDTEQRWQPDDWRAAPRVQMPDYPDPAALAQVRARLRASAPLVFPGELDRLRAALGEVAAGRGFLLQGGDCAESFEQFSPDRLQRLFRVFLQMALVLTWGAAVPVVKVGRVAGQFAKPRSSATETRDGQSLPAYRGDIVNDIAFSAAARRPDPQRMLRAYAQSAASMNYLRALSQGGYASLESVAAWNADFTARAAISEQYRRMHRRIDQALRFTRACGLAPERQDAFAGVAFFSSHEALLLDYESALVRRAEDGRAYAGSGHLLWIGERTRQPDGAHVRFLAGLANPVGLKVGPTMTVDTLLRTIERLNPHRQPGRLTLITRFGAGQVRDCLAPLARAVRAAGEPVVWCCDPMHGNTVSAAGGRKTRDFGAIADEVAGFFAVLCAEGCHPGGLHVEMSGDEVTECTGGHQRLDEAALAAAYETRCDPRLNAGQSLELAFAVAAALGEARGERD